MKEYSKIYSVNCFIDRINNDIEIIKKYDSRYNFKIEKDIEKENFIFLFKYYNGEQVTAIYNTIDVISEHLKAIKQTLKIIKDY